MQHQVDDAERKLRDEKSSHETTKEELEMIQQELENVREEKRSLEEEVDGKVASATVALAAEMKLKDKVGMWILELSGGYQVIFTSGKWYTVGYTFKIKIKNNIY